MILAEYRVGEWELNLYSCAERPSNGRIFGLKNAQEIITKVI